jgi:hypothetical protein
MATLPRQNALLRSMYAGWLLAEAYLRLHTDLKPLETPAKKSVTGDLTLTATSHLFLNLSGFIVCLQLVSSLLHLGTCVRSN